MKNIKFLYLTILALAGVAFTACTADQTGDERGSAQVYFPNDFDTDYIVQDSDEYIIVPLHRINADEALTVTVLSYDPTNMFYGCVDSEVTFYQGYKDAEIYIRVPSQLRASQYAGQKFPLSLMIYDDHNTTAYGNSEIEFTVRVWPWERIIGNLGEEVFGTYRDDVICSIYSDGVHVETKVAMYKHKTKKGIYLVENMFQATLEAYYGGTIEAIAASGYGTYTPTDVEIDASDPDAVVIRGSATGYSIPDLGMLYLVSVEDNSGNIMTGTLKDGIITFPNSGLGLANYEGNGYYANASGAFRLVLPGYTAKEMDLSGKFTGMTVDIDGKAWAGFDFTFGKDVEWIKYAAIKGSIPYSVDRMEENEETEGDEETGETTPDSGTEETAPEKPELTAMDVAEQIATGVKECAIETADGSDTCPVFEAETFGYDGLLSTSEEISNGLYTLVAVPVNGGEYNTKETFADTFYFQGMGGNPAPPCELSLVAKPVSVGDPQSMGIYPDHKAFYWEIRNTEGGAELKSLSICIVTSEVAENPEKFGLSQETLLSQYSTDISEWAIEELEENGFVYSIASRLQPNTSYTMMVQAENVYGKTYYDTMEYTTSAAAEYNGELRIGQYFMSDSRMVEVEDQMGNISTVKEEYYNIFEIMPTNDSNKFLVSQLGTSNMQPVFNAVYNPEALTLTLDGTTVNIPDKNDEYTNIFGVRKKASEYSWYLYYSSVDEAAFKESKFDTPLVFKVDARTKAIYGLQTRLQLDMWQRAFSSDGSSEQKLVGAYIYTADSPIVPYGSSNNGNTNEGEAEEQVDGGNTTASVNVCALEKVAKRKHNGYVTPAAPKSEMKRRVALIPTMISSIME